MQLPTGHRAPYGAQLWSSDAAVTGAVDLAAQLADAFPRTGLWPVLWSWKDESPDGYVDAAGRLGHQGSDRRAEAILRAAWTRYRNLTTDAPFDRSFAGLARPSGDPALSRNPFRVLRRTALSPYSLAGGPYRLMLVAVTRPAETLRAIAPLMTEYFSDAELSTVLGSWEQRFGARIAVLGPGYLSLVVDRPPRGGDARRLAGEFFALQPDAETSPIDDVARQIAGTRPPVSDGFVEGPGLWSLAWPD